MSYMFLDNTPEGYPQYNLYSVLPFVETISPLLKTLFRHEDLYDVEYRRQVFDDNIVSYVRVVLGRTVKQGEAVFDNVLLNGFMDNHLPNFELVNDTTPRRWGQSTLTHSEITKAFIQLAEVHRLNMEYKRTLAKCQLEFEKNNSNSSAGELLKLSEKFGLSGGSWLLHVKNPKIHMNRETNERITQTVPDSQQKEISKHSFFGILKILEDNKLPRNVFKAVRWIGCPDANGQKPYVVKITNMKCNYFENFVENGEDKCELWYFTKDNQVKQLYRLLVRMGCAVLSSQNLSYKAEVVTACNLNRRSSNDKIILCVYPSLRHTQMVMENSEQLEVEYAKPIEGSRFGTIKWIRHRDVSLSEKEYSKSSGSSYLSAGPAEKFGNTRKY